MIPLTTMTATRTTGNQWLAFLYSGIFSAIAGLILVLLLNTPILWPLAGILIGIGPVLGYDLARGQLGANWRPLIGGLIGYILFVIGWIPFFIPFAALAVPVLVVVASILSVILWPIVVGLMSPTQSVGRLFLGSLLGLVLGAIVMLAILANLIGQNPSWIATGMILFWAVWAATCGAVMTVWAK